MTEDDRFIDDGDPLTEELTPLENAFEEERAINVEKARKILEARMYAYRRVFGEGDDARAVLDDLIRFCRGDATPWHPDARMHALLTGRHEVHRRIEDFKTLSLDQLVERYLNGKRPSET